MRRLFYSLLALLLLPHAAQPEAAASAASALTVLRAWSRATPPGTTVGVAFFEIRNEGPADTLLGIECALADHVEMHDTHVLDGVMQMRAAASVAVPAHGSVVFHPGGLHAMLLALKQPLRAGDALTLTLVFRTGGRIEVRAPVREIGATGPQATATPPPAAASVAMPPRSAAAPHDSQPPAYRLAQWPATLAAPVFKLDDTDGHERTPADYRGRLLVVFFGFTHCPDVCPAGLFKLAQVTRQLGSERDRVQVLFVTLDPRRDGPAALKRYVQAFDPAFVGLTGSDAAVDAAAASFHVEYAKVATGKDYTIDHSTGVFLLDATGRLRLVGSTSSPTADFVHDLRLLAGR